MFILILSELRARNFIQAMVDTVSSRRACSARLSRSRRNRRSRSNRIAREQSTLTAPFQDVRERGAIHDVSQHHRARSSGTIVRWLGKNAERWNPTCVAGGPNGERERDATHC